MKIERLLKYLIVVLTNIICLLIWWFYLSKFDYQSEWFYLLLLIPLLSVFYIFYSERIPSIRTSSLKGFQNISLSIWVPLKNLLFSLNMIGLTFLILCLARPQSKTDFEDITKEGIDMILAMDVSGSMKAVDFKPNRLEASKKVAEKFVEDRPNDRFGIVLYEGESYTAVPLTSDQKVIVESIKTVESGLIEGGTAIGLGLATAVNRLKDSNAKSKVIILLTDGANNSGNISPVDAADLAKTFGIRVYTVGIGDYGKAPFPSKDRYGNRTYTYLEDEIDEDLMKEISRKTDGLYFRATDMAKLNEIYSYIDELEKTKFNVTRYSKKSEEYFSFGVYAFILLVLSFILSKTLFRSFP